MDHQPPQPADGRRYFAEAVMQFVRITTLTFALVVAGCSAESSRQSATTTPSVIQSSELATAETPVVERPKYIAAIFITAATKGEGGMKCSAGMGSKGEFRCGPDISLTDLSWEFTEHRDESDFYKFNWTLTSNGEAKNSKGLSIGFDGVSETTVIDEEHYIVIRRGPLHPNTAAEAK